MPGSSRQRIEDLRQAVDPDLVIQIVQRREHVLAPPLAEQAARLVHDVAQAEHEARAALLQHQQGLAHLAAQAERLLVDQEQVRVEDVGGVADDRAAHRERLLEVEVQLERRVFAVAQLDHARHAHEVDPGFEIEAADDRRPRQDQHREIGERVDQMMRDRPATPQVPEPEAVVAVDQKPSCAFHGAAFAQPLSRRHYDRPGRSRQPSVGRSIRSMVRPASSQVSEAMAVETQHRRKRSGETIGAGGFPGRTPTGLRARPGRRRGAVPVLDRIHPANHMMPQAAYCTV